MVDCFVVVSVVDVGCGGGGVCGVWLVVVGVGSVVGCG